MVCKLYINKTLKIPQECGFFCIMCSRKHNSPYFPPFFLVNTYTVIVQTIPSVSSDIYSPVLDIHPSSHWVMIKRNPCLRPSWCLPVTVSPLLWASLFPGNILNSLFHQIMGLMRAQDVSWGWLMSLSFPVFIKETKWHSNKMISHHLSPINLQIKSLAYGWFIAPVPMSSPLPQDSTCWMCIWWQHLSILKPLESLVLTPGPWNYYKVPYRHDCGGRLPRT